MSKVSTTLKLAALCAAGVATLRVIDAESHSRRESAEGIVLSRRFPDVESIDVLLSNGEHRVFMHSAGGWAIASPVAANADSSKVLSLLDAVEGFSRVATVTARDMELRELSAGDFGLAAPRARIAISTPRGKFSLALGASPPASTNEIFAQIGGEQSISVIRPTLLDILESPLENFSDRRLCHAPLADVSRISIESGPVETLRLKRAPAGEGWHIVAPEPMPADWAEMQKFLDALGQAKIKSFLYEPEARRAAGLEGDDSAPLKIKLYSDTTPFPATIAIGRRLPGDDNCAAETDGGLAAAISAETARALSITPGSVRDRRVFPAGPTLDVSSLVLSVSNGVQVALSRDSNGDWLLRSPVEARADQELVARLVAQLLSLRASEYVPASRFQADSAVSGFQPLSSVSVEFAAQDATNRIGCLFLAHSSPSAEGAADDVAAAPPPSFVAVASDNAELAALAPASSLSAIASLAADPYSAVSRSFGGYALRDILSISVSRADGSSQRFDIAPDGSMAIGGDDAGTEPISDSGEISVRLAAMARFLADISATGVLPHPASDGDAGGADDHGAQLISVAVEPRNPSDPPVSIYFGEAADGGEGVLARVGASGAVFVFPAQVREIFARNFRESYHAAETPPANYGASNDQENRL